MFLLTILGLGVWLLVLPLAVYEIRGRIYTEEFLQGFSTRIAGRAFGAVLMLFSISGLSWYLDDPKLSRRFFEALTIVFIVVWVSGRLFELVTRFHMGARIWTRAHSTDMITPRENRVEIAVCVGVVLLATGWAVLPVVLG